MSNWIMKLYDLYFQEFVEYMHNQLLKCEYINADETKLEVLELKKENERLRQFVESIPQEIRQAFQERQREQSAKAPQR